MAFSNGNENMMKNHKIFGIRPQIKKKCRKIENRHIFFFVRNLFTIPKLSSFLLLVIDFYSFEVKLFKLFRRAKQHKYIYIHMSMYVNASIQICQIWQNVTMHDQSCFYDISMFLFRFL